MSAAREHPVFTVDGDEIPVCEFCDDNGEVTVGVARDSFGTWDTEVMPCSCPAGDPVAAAAALVGVRGAA